MTSPVMWDVVGHFTVQTLRPGALGLPPYQTRCGKPLESKVSLKMAPVWLPGDPQWLKRISPYILPCVKCNSHSLSLNAAR